MGHVNTVRAQKFDTRARPKSTGRKVDHGPVILQEILQEPVPIEPGDTEESLHTRIKRSSIGCSRKACRLILEGKVQLRHGTVVISDA